MMIVEKDIEIKNAFNSIINKYEGTNLSKSEWDKVVQSEVIPFAKKYGYDFTLEDLAELQKTAGGKMSDEELDGVVGGRGEFSQIDKGWIYTMILTTFCNFMPDDQTFKTRYEEFPTDCPDYVRMARRVVLNGCAPIAHTVRIAYQLIRIINTVLSNQGQRSLAWSIKIEA
jgi:hypothetical protein